MNEADFDAVFRQIPLLADIPVSAFRITPLPGLTNHNFHLRHRDENYILRIPGKHSHQFIDRKNEAYNTGRAIDMGLAPPTLWRNESGLSLTQCIPRARNLQKDDFHDDELLETLIEKLAILHSSNPVFKGQTDMNRLLEEHFDLMPEDRQQELSAKFEKGLDINDRITGEDSPRVASHNDLVLENMLIDRERNVWLVDWEYSSLSSPYWDLATICNSARLQHQQRQQLLLLYNQGNASLGLDILIGYQYILQLLTIGWLIVHTGESIDVEIDWLTRLERSLIRA